MKLVVSHKRKRKPYVYMDVFIVYRLLFYCGCHIFRYSLYTINVSGQKLKTMITFQSYYKALNFNSSGNTARNEILYRPVFVYVSESNFQVSTFTTEYWLVTRHASLVRSKSRRRP